MPSQWCCPLDEQQAEFGTGRTTQPLAFRAILSNWSTWAIICPRPLSPVCVGQVAWLRLTYVKVSQVEEHLHNRLSRWPAPVSATAPALSPSANCWAAEKWLNTESPEPGASARWQSLIYAPAPNGLSAIPVLTCLLRDTMQKQPDIFYFRLFCWESFALKTGLLAAIATLTNAWYTCDVSVKS